MLAHTTALFFGSTRLMSILSVQKGYHCQLQLMQHKRCLVDVLLKESCQSGLLPCLALFLVLQLLDFGSDSRCCSGVSLFEVIAVTVG